MEKEKKKSSGLLTGIFCALAGVAVGIGGKLLYDEVTKDTKQEEKLSYQTMKQVREEKKNMKKNQSDQDTENGGEAEYESFFCPISQEIMKDPVITPKGISFDRESITSWLKRNNNCPITKTPLKEGDLITNYALKNTIDDYLSKQK